MNDWPARPYIADNTLHVCDWLDLMQALPDASVDMILTDMPYGTTACAWDTVIDLTAWWVECRRVMKPRGAVVCTASGLFEVDLIISNREWFKYKWIWVNKSRPTFFIHAKNRPLKVTEEVLVFSSGAINHETVSDNRMSYYPQFTEGEPYKRDASFSKFGSVVGKRPSHKYMIRVNDGTRYPVDVIEINESNNGVKHPTQKPVALFEYLIKTYTQPGELVVDPFVGSGTTAVAARITGRRFICGDQSEEYIDIAHKRVFPTFGQPPKRKREEKPITDLPLFAGLAS